MSEVDANEDLDATVGSDLVRGGLWTVLSALVGVPLGVLSNVILARTLGVSGLGVYGQILVVWSIASMIVNTGVSAASVQWMALSRGRRDRATFLRVVSVCSAYHAMLQAPVLALVVVVVVRDAPVWVVVLAALSTFLEQALGTSSVVMSGAARNARAAQIGIAFSLLRVAILIVAALTLPEPAVVWGLAQTAGIFSIVISWRNLRPSERRAMRSLRAGWPWPAGFARYARNVGIAGLAGSLVFGRSELLVLGVYGQDAAAGFFVVATAIASLITVPLDSLMGPLAPAAAYYTGVSRQRATEMLERSVALSSVLAGASAVVAPSVIVVMVPLVYGGAFEGAVTAGFVLAALSLLQSVLNPMATFSLAAGRSGALLKIGIASAVVDVALAVALIPAWGIGGAVAASGAGQLVHLAATTELAARCTDSTRARLLLRACPLVVGLLLGSVAASVTLVTQPPGLVGVGLGVVALVVFRLILFVFPNLSITFADWDRLLAAMGPRTRLAAKLARVLLGSGRPV